MSNHCLPPLIVFAHLHFQWNLEQKNLNQPFSNICWHSKEQWSLQPFPCSSDAWHIYGPSWHSPAMGWVLSWGGGVFLDHCPVPFCTLGWEGSLWVSCWAGGQLTVCCGSWGGVNSMCWVGGWSHWGFVRRTPREDLGYCSTGTWVLRGWWEVCWATLWSVKQPVKKLTLWKWVIKNYGHLVNLCWNVLNSARLASALRAASWLLGSCTCYWRARSQAAVLQAG